MIDLVMGYPQWIYVGCILYNIITAGKPRREPSHRWAVQIELAGSVITFALLYWGGFFS